MRRIWLLSSALFALSTLALPAQSSLKEQFDACLKSGGAHSPAYSRKIAGDLDAAKVKHFGDSSLIYYAVPAMSTVKRLPTTYPHDGELFAPLRIVAAKGEYEPASFVILPFRGIKQLELRVSELKNASGATIKTENLDLKVVKCWYQGGTAWYSYFADINGRSLVPELLLNDENLVRVDLAKKENFLRVNEPDGPKYRWMGYPQKEIYNFNAMVEPVADAPILQPVTLNPMEFKQFWLTVKVPENAAPGIYSGKIALNAEGKLVGEIPITLRVLPFSLPQPKTYYDLNRTFFASSYHPFDYEHIYRLNGNNKEQADRFIENALRNMAAHNMIYPFYVDNPELWKKTGMATDVLFGLRMGDAPHFMWVLTPDEEKRNQRDWDRFEAKTKERVAYYRKHFGDLAELYVIGWDEAAPGICRSLLKPWQFLNENGIKLMSTCYEHQWRLAGHIMEFANYPGVGRKENADQWHATGGLVSTYAGPHMGPENPDLNRRNHGFLMYKRNQDGTFNYILSELTNPWNEFFDSGHNYRRFTLVYPTPDSVIDTIGWEGFREGIDDVRYATLLKMVADKAIKTGKIQDVYTARAALQWLALLDEEACDLNAVRLEMISYILKLQKHL